MKDRFASMEHIIDSEKSLSSQSISYLDLTETPMIRGGNNIKTGTQTTKVVSKTIITDAEEKGLDNYLSPVTLLEARSKANKYNRNKP